ncbi:hypothetical protein SARC_12121 [Sphaeroforma arctica JP610]|uniref:Uncharacterized protein n=1 Tax=Sphaeroforma arctica JP610 TaxID=667725 RepID=A0A0L0FFV0_9EUKA|nr:hypothetical protein SARC_12121 [Sphaeroforma arctica JP610]KNC75351.1 hypothetical protein SARC_12121 [Sphaeroforma arctica JP610]|eukprot:XP_014149253.1 hypothetical protein SARC_12121 [Sphaeroforma arctica JP610]
MYKISITWDPNWSVDFGRLEMFSGTIVGFNSDYNLQFPFEIKYVTTLLIKNTPIPANHQRLLNVMDKRTPKWRFLSNCDAILRYKSFVDLRFCSCLSLRMGRQRLVYLEMIKDVGADSIKCACAWTVLLLPEKNFYMHWQMPVIEIRLKSSPVNSCCRCRPPHTPPPYEKGIPAEVAIILNECDLHREQIIFRNIFSYGPI